MAEQDDSAILAELQRQIGVLLGRKRERQARRAMRGQVAYDPATPPGPKPTPMDVARAKRVLRGAR